MEDLGIVLGLAINVYAQYLVYRYLFVYYMKKGKKAEFEKDKTAITIVIIVISLVIYSTVSAASPIIALAFLIGLIYFAFTLHKKWKLNDILPDPISSINKDNFSDLDE